MINKSVWLLEFFPRPIWPTVRGPISRLLMTHHILASTLSRLGVSSTSRRFGGTNSNHQARVHLADHPSENTNGDVKHEVDLIKGPFVQGL